MQISMLYPTEVKHSSRQGQSTGNCPHFPPFITSHRNSQRKELFCRSSSFRNLSKCHLLRPQRIPHRPTQTKGDTCQEVCLTRYWESMELPLAYHTGEEKLQILPQSKRFWAFQEMSLSSLGWANIPLELSPLGPCRLCTFLVLDKQNQNVFLQVLVGKVISYSHIKMHPSSNTRFWVVYLSPIHPTQYGRLITYKRSSDQLPVCEHSNFPVRSC